MAAFDDTIDETMGTHMRALKIAGIMVVSGLFQAGFAADGSAGEALVKQHCQGCHDNGIFSRPDSIIHSYPELQARVEFCDNAAQAHLNEAQIAQVVEYLNNTYYKFTRP